MKIIQVMVIAILVLGCTACKGVVRSQVKEIADGIQHPPGSVIVSTEDDVLPPGNSDTCVGSDRFYVIGSSLSEAEVSHYYEEELSSKGWVMMKTPHGNFSWEKSDSMTTLGMSIEYRESWLDYFQSTQEVLNQARTKFPTVYVLAVYVYTKGCSAG